jgi:hypothetical protein
MGNCRPPGKKAPAMDAMLTLNWEKNMNSYTCLLRCHRTRNNFGLFLFISVISLLILQGCSTFSRGTLPNGHSWGQDATFSPGWDRIKRSAVKAALSPETWGPVAGALALQINNTDKRISNWASDKIPVFGTQRNANNWSNWLEVASGVVYITTVMVEPSGDEEWGKNKVKGLAIGAAASGVTAATTQLAEMGYGRTRPNNKNDLSMPSGHASSTAVFSTLARRNFDTLSLSPGTRMLAGIGMLGMTAGEGWARVEAKGHYPSDVLVGYSLGYFLSALINDAFLGLDDNEKGPQLAVEPSRKGTWVGLNWTF